MQISKWLVALFTILLLGGRAWSQSVDDIISKHLDAMGGKDKLVQITSLYEEGTSSIMGNDLPTKYWIVNNSHSRMELSFNGTMIVTVLGKDSGWAVNPLAGAPDPQPIPTDALKYSDNRLVLGSPFLNLQDRGYTAALLGSEKVDGKDTYKIKLSKSGVPDSYYYIDATTYYIDKCTIPMFLNGGSAPRDLVFTEFKKSPEGITYASTYTMNVDQGDLQTVITKVVFNQPIDQKEFQNP